MLLTIQAVFFWSTFPLKPVRVIAPYVCTWLMLSPGPTLSSDTVCFFHDMLDDEFELIKKILGHL
jgi:hypothetical protein